MRTDTAPEAERRLGGCRPAVGSISAKRVLHGAVTRCSGTPPSTARALMPPAGQEPTDTQHATMKCARPAGLQWFLAQVVVLPNVRATHPRSPPTVVRELPLATLNIKNYADLAEHEASNSAADDHPLTNFVVGWLVERSTTHKRSPGTRNATRKPVDADQ